MFEKGNISIHTENIFPIIKKWLYSEKDIFIRELVSNASDAINKFKKLVAIGNAPDIGSESYRIDVILDKAAKTIAIEDNGIGMTADEVKKYINQIAFSGAQDFMEKYSGKTDDAQIIGHFGLGFYSSFMVSDKVTIDTLSWQENSESVRWESDGGTDFILDESERTTRGTTITMFIADDSVEFLDMYKIKETLTKYFEFLPVEIFVDEIKDETEEVEGESKEEGTDEVIQPTPINDTNPLWIKNPKDCTDEEYKEFYRKTFNDYNDPLFWIHLNLEFPFNLKGILYFPKLKHEFETIEGKIKLYYNQVFVADNLKEVIPEFLMLLKGCLDCPDLPLNVSRSFLQNDGTIRKLATHITKKVSDKLNALYNTEFDNYSKYWDDISPFVKYGCMRDDKFYEAVKDIILFKSINGNYITLKKEDEEKSIYYVNDQKAQNQYISAFKENNLDAVILDTMIDSHFVNFIEMKGGIRFKSIDTDITEALKGDYGQLNDEQSTELAGFIGSILEIESDEFKKERGNFTVEVKPLKSNSLPSLLQQSEEARRMAEMSRTFGGMDLSGMYPKQEILVLNANHPLVESLFDMKDNDDLKEKSKLISEYLLDLAILQSRQLEPDGMRQFIERSVKLMQAN